MKKNVIISALLCLLILPQHSFAIYNGVTVPPGSYSQVIGFETKQGRCSGVFVTESVILTAAHCVTYKQGVISTKKIKVALENRNHYESYNVSKIIKHEQFEMLSNGTFNLKNSAVDIALIFLTEKVSQTLGADLIMESDIYNNTYLSAHQKIEIVAMGFDEKGKDTYKKRTLLNFEKLTSLGVIQINNTGLKSSLCHGDSGGVVFSKLNGVNKLVGLLSAVGKDCGHGSQQSYAVPLFQNLNWIKSHI